MAHWKLTLMYDGTSFHGWQVQPGLPTVQGLLAEALHRLTGESVLPQGSGRTDAGVHALAQVCSFTLCAPLPPPNLQRALNHLLPASVRVLTAEHAPEHFHARHSAAQKTYEYRLFPRRGVLASKADHPKTESPNTEGFYSPLRTSAPASEAPIAADHVCPPFLAPFVWDLRWPLDFDALQHAAALLCGTHDFTSFAALDPDRSTRPAAESEDPAAPVPSAIRTLFGSAWEHRGDLLLYRVTGSGFLHHMVRNLVGTLVEIGRGSLAPTCIPAILAARSRVAAGPTAPARGLFLVSVNYAATPPGEALL